MSVKSWLFRFIAIVATSGGLPVVAEVHVCIENGQKVFRSAPCPEDTATGRSYVAPPDPVRRRVITRPAPVAEPAAERELAAPAKPTEDCDRYITAAEGTWSRASQESLRQRCLDRNAGITRPATRATCATFGNVTNCVTR